MPYRTEYQPRIIAVPTSVKYVELEKAALPGTESWVGGNWYVFKGDDWIYSIHPVYGAMLKPVS